MIMYKIVEKDTEKEVPGMTFSQYQEAEKNFLDLRRDIRNKHYIKKCA